jgi:hypothetical protein
MKYSIAGIMPADAAEVTATVVWPSIAMYPSGRFLGRLYAIRWPDVYIFKLGNLLALLSIPHALCLYFLRLLPKVGRSYRLTNRRVVVQCGYAGPELRAIGLSGFDSIHTEVQPGQAWYDAADLVFRNDGAEVFRLEGVSRPEAFRQSCLKSRMAYVSVRQVMTQQAASA